MSIQREVDGSYVIRSSPVKLLLIHDAVCVVVFVMSQYPSALMLAVDVVTYELGRRELFVLQDHEPVRNIILEKSGFGVMGIGVLSTCEKAAVDDRAAKAKAHRGTRKKDISPLLSTAMLRSCQTSTAANYKVPRFINSRSKC